MVESSETTEVVDTQPKPAKTSDRIDQLEDMIIGLARTVDGLSSALAAPQGLNRTVAPDKLLEGSIEDVRKRVIDLKYPGRAEEGVQPDDVIVPLPGSELEGKLRSGLRLGSDEPTPLGTVLNYMYVTKREGEPKYKVFFRGYGKDGCLARERQRVEL